MFSTGAKTGRQYASIGVGPREQGPENPVRSGLLHSKDSVDGVARSAKLRRIFASVSGGGVYFLWMSEHDWRWVAGKAFWSVPDASGAG